MTDGLNNTYTCETCGAPLEVGQWPFCRGNPDAHGQPSFMAARDAIPGGVVLENYGPEPVRFFSHGERRRYMKAHGLRETERFAALPGTDKDPQGVPHPNGYRDLSAAAIIARNGRGTSAEGPTKDALAGGPALDPTDRFDIPNTPGEQYGIPQFNYAVEGRRRDG
jgi:hypothetical protein